jgi:hypothetical protein
MIDWPRRDVMHHLLASDNLALVTRRQMLPTQECNFFWVADAIVIDGLVRSDNRGSESFFPLFLAGAGEPCGPQATEARRVNFAPAFVAAVERATSLRWRSARPDDLQSSFGAEDLFAYVYALFHSPTYRQTYATRLQLDFPRILLPGSSNLLQDLATIGKRLISRHRDPISEPAAGPRLAPAAGRPSAGKQKTEFPRYVAGRILVNDQIQIEGVAPETWAFHVGGHQVCRKWLRDRRGRRLETADLDFYCSLVAAVSETRSLMAKVDDAIALHGGWPGAFRRPASDLIRDYSS